MTPLSMRIRNLFIMYCMLTYPIQKDSRKNDYRIRIKSFFIRELFWKCLKKYDSKKGLYINGDICFDWDFWDWNYDLID